MKELRILLTAVAIALGVPCLALAQDEGADEEQPAAQPQDEGQGQPQDPSQDPAATAPAEDAAPTDPVTSLQGLWRVDRVEGEAAGSGAFMGKVMRIERAAVASLTGGTCTNPGFAASGDATATTVEISCLGQVLATAAWNPAAPDEVAWAEPKLQAVLHRITGTTP